MTTFADTPWGRAILARSLFAIDPAGLGGIWLRARAGPVRDRWLAGLDCLHQPPRRIGPGISDTQLFGGIDLAETLAAGHLVESGGLLGQPAVMLLGMAERAGTDLAARLSLALDGDGGHGLIALDEGAEPDELLSPALADRLALHVGLDDTGLRDATAAPPGAADIAAARDRLSSVTVPDTAAKELTVLAAQLGIASLRAPLQALAVTRAHAALRGQSVAGPDDIAVAAALVYANRATILPEDVQDAPDDTRDPPPPDPQSQAEPPDDSDTPAQPEDALPQDILLDAVAAALPPDLLARLAAQKARRGVGASGTGAVRKGNRRGRPLPSRPGRLDGNSRIDLVATLRAAAPWQTIRRRSAPRDQTLYIRGSDIRLKRFEEKSDRLLIFTVDASGSAALARLAEAKGAVELLLAEAYARRDHVALIAFRGTGADLLLPPTRSLVQTKRRLGALPGGGGTPLAKGLEAALTLAAQARGRGMTPTLCLLTDGRANIALDGSADRTAAATDARRMATAISFDGIPGLVIDMSKRPQPGLRDLAATMGAPYLPLPRADAGRLSTAVSAALEV